MSAQLMAFLFVMWLLIVTTAVVISSPDPLQILNSPPQGCRPKRSPVACKLMTRLNPECKDWVLWVGRGCPRYPLTKSKRRKIKEGGCQYKYKCGFSCKKECQKQNQCRWVRNPKSASKKNGRCVKRFSITSEFLQPEYQSDRFLKAMTQAYSRWAKLLKGHEGWGRTPNVSQSICNALYTLTPDLVLKDLHIMYDFISLDGLGGTIASAAPCVVWNDGTTAVGVVRIDVDDFEDSVAQPGSFFVDLLAHEIGHVLGLGNRWKSRGLIKNTEFPGEPGYGEYNGTHGLAGFRRTKGSNGNLQVETFGGAATRFRHWNEDQLEGELMSASLSDTSRNPLSEISGRALVDLGYTLLDYVTFEPYTIVASSNYRRLWKSFSNFESAFPDVDLLTLVRPDAEQ